MMVRHKNHNWSRSEDQNDVGFMGIRLTCTLDTFGGRYIQHFETVHYALIDQYLNSGTSREDA